MQSLTVQHAVSALAGAPGSFGASHTASTRTSTAGLCYKFSHVMGTAFELEANKLNSFKNERKHVERGSAVKVRANLLDPLGLMDRETKVKVKGTASISKRTVLDVDNPTTSIVDTASDVLGMGITDVEFRLVSEQLGKDKKPKLSKDFPIKNWLFADKSILAGEEKYDIDFEIDEDFGEIGGFTVRNKHPNEFYLHSLKLEVGGKTIDFFCNSWINPELYETKLYGSGTSRSVPDRVFFVNKPYLPSETPEGLKAYRQEDLKLLRGDGTGTRKSFERIYDYDVYNDLSNADAKPPVFRPVLGGPDFPYPRRCRTGRGYSTKTNPKRPNDKFEKYLLGDGIVDAVKGLFDFYVPCDEFFGAQKSSGFLAVALKSVAHNVVPTIKNLFDETPYFDSLDDINKLYDNGVKVPDAAKGAKGSAGSFLFVDTIFHAEGDDTSVLKFPVPQVYNVNDMAWSYDQEFGRQTLAGLNPVVIEAVKEFPPKSTLDKSTYGEATILTEEHILPYLEGLSVEEAINQKKLFTIDHHDAFLVYLEKIMTQANKFNTTPSGYAPRALFFLTDEGVMKPIAIELTKFEGIREGYKHRVFTPPPREGDKNHLWDLAKVHFSMIDFGVHEVYSHWVRTHAVVEPFIIATRRQLSTMHPIYSLLSPMFKNTMMINAAARFSLINAKGIIESCFFPGEYSMEMSSVLYKQKWTFEKQALPTDLLNRGMAVPDNSKPGGVRLVVEDYPFARDGLDLWDAIHEYISEFVNAAYKQSDDAVRKDTELQAWWDEIKTKGHPDIKEGWPTCNSIKDLIEICCIIQWISGPHHAAVNFGQYGYAGFMPNKPSTCARFIPEKGSNEYQELERDPMRFLLSTVAPQSVATTVGLTVELLATHGVDEEYLGTRLEDAQGIWTSDPKLRAAFDKFSEKIRKLEQKFEERNSDPKNINRSGPAVVPYTLLYPHSKTSGLTGMGVPYSVSI